MTHAKRIRRRTLLALAFGTMTLAGGAGGCDPSKPDWGWHRSTATSGPAEETVEVRPAREEPASEGGWVIVLNEYEGPNYRRDAEAARDWLKNRNWGVGLIHDFDKRRSRVYLGPFDRYDSEEFQDSLRKIKSLVNEAGDRRFPGAYIDRLPTKAPAGDEQWNLANAKGVWTLQIAYFVEPGPAHPEVDPKGLPPGFDRKKVAVEVCRGLRAQDIEAYYHHGPTMSHVTVGAFPIDAFGYNPKTDTFQKYNRDRDEYLDERVRAYRDREDFKYNLLNGVAKVKRVYRTAAGGRVERYMPSFLVPVPGKVSNVLEFREPRGMGPPGFN